MDFNCSLVVDGNVFHLQGTLLFESEMDFIASKQRNTPTSSKVTSQQSSLSPNTAQNPRKKHPLRWEPRWELPHSAHRSSALNTCPVLRSHSPSVLQCVEGSEAMVLEGQDGVFIGCPQRDTHQPGVC